MPIEIRLNNDVSIFSKCGRSSTLTFVANTKHKLVIITLIITSQNKLSFNLLFFTIVDIMLLAIIVKTNIIKAVTSNNLPSSFKFKTKEIITKKNINKLSTSK